MIKINCLGCKHRCVTDEQYLAIPPVNMNGDVVEFNCIVIDEEIDITLPKPICYKEEE